MNLREIQDDIVQRYRIKLDPESKCRTRTHAHPKQRRVCKWVHKNSMPNTFTLFHEIGHVETHKSWMRRCEQEYYATIWAIDVWRNKYGLSITEKLLYKYQNYILMEIYRGKRRHGKGYGVLDLYKYAGIHKTKAEMKKLFPRYESVIDEWQTL